MKKKLIKSPLYFFLALSVLFLSCQPEKTETATKGKTTCYVDESLYPMVEALKDSFMAKYPETKIELSKLKAREGLVKVLNQEATMFICSRGLNDEEDSFLKKTKSPVQVVKFCYDAITVVVDADHPLARITTTQLKQLLLGSSTQYRIYIPDQNSGIFENLRVEFLEKKNPAGAYIVSTEEEVVKSVLKNKNAIGIVGLNVARKNDKLKIVRLGTDERYIEGGVYYEPAAGYLSNGEYPLIRTCYIFLNEIGILVGTGFTSFITSTEGQKIILAHDLGPATVPIRYKQITRLR